jgi:hypothetical protein
MNVNCANDHDWSDNHDVSCDLENFMPHIEYIIDDKNCILLKLGLEECRL